MRQGAEFSVVVFLGNQAEPDCISPTKAEP
jgi:hypothetical protein